jgi:nitrogenase subunit NifH
MSILQYAGSSEGANAYRALAKAVIARGQPAQASPAEAQSEAEAVATRV